jgi:hypothetical protein
VISELLSLAPAHDIPGLLAESVRFVGMRD